MIKNNNVKAFWSKRAEKLNSVPFESIANLEENEKLLELKIKLEQERIYPLLQLDSQTDLLDLGAGVGQWSFRFAPKVNSVTAVDFIDDLLKIGKLEAEKRQFKNIEFILSHAEEFTSQQKFDVVFISGLFVYLSHEQAEKLMKNVQNLIKPNGLLFIRDGTSINDKEYILDNQYSEILNTYYSAIYRTSSQYIDLLSKYNFSVQKHGQMFDEGTPLNKFKNTRLWYYSCKPKTPE